MATTTKQKERIRAGFEARVGPARAAMDRAVDRAWRAKRARNAAIRAYDAVLRAALQWREGELARAGRT